MRDGTVCCGSTKINAHIGPRYSNIANRRADPSAGLSVRFYTLGVSRLNSHRPPHRLRPATVKDRCGSTPAVRSSVRERPESARKGHPSGISAVLLPPVAALHSLTGGCPLPPAPSVPNTGEARAAPPTPEV